MRGEWSYFKNYFSSSDCDKIIKQALEIPEQPGTIGSSSVDVKESIRRSQIRPILRSAEWIDLFNEIDKLVATANRRWFNVDYNFLPAIQFAEYDSENSGFYARHQDTFLISPISTHRKLSFTVQLSDPESYMGGDLKFSDIGIQPNSDNMRSRGTVCVFPSIIFHEVTPVLSGKRFSLAGWYEGPPWR
jgi:PKHD-type hydroxylase